jgi:DNA modification methylase
LSFRIIQGDCEVELKKFPDASFDCLIVDMPYHLTNNSGGPHGKGVDTPFARSKAGAATNGFMGLAWDGGDLAHRVSLWKEAIRVVKPGGHLLAFSAARTYHRMACAIEDAGFEIRDQLMWIYGCGFPKSRDVSKDIDRVAGADRQVVGLKHVGCGNRKGEGFRHAGSTAGVPVTAPVTEEAQQWDGWGTGLKPAHEPICMARKPFPGPVFKNVLKHGTGALNIDACRVPPVSPADAEGYSDKCASVVGLDSNRTGDTYGEWNGTRTDSASPLGRWPANIIHDGSAEVIDAFPDSEGAGGSVPNVKVTGYGSGIGTGQSEYFGGDRAPFESGSGSAARFFYSAKASNTDRNEGCEHLPNQNFHPTVKPTELMRWLCRLVTPPGGKILDICTGSASTGKAAILEGFDFTGIELDRDESGQPIGYIDIANARCEWAERQHAESTRQGRLDLEVAA